MSTKRVLFVDDDDTFQIIAKHIANLSHIVADKCYDPITAIEMMKKRKYDIVFVDQRLPDMDGTELIGIIADQYPETDFYLVT